MILGYLAKHVQRKWEKHAMLGCVVVSIQIFNV